MLLALSVISGQGASLGSSAYKLFDERGGSIGRLDSNDWALPDPERFVSSRHAVVRFQDGGFCLEDVSTNGTFLNEPDRPVSKDGPVRLKDGDRLFIGDYEIMVQL
ncbi:MAG: type VI secretion system-associated FHA domain protein TagH, partial [Steroidobacterales bacterium]